MELARKIAPGPIAEMTVPLSKKNFAVSKLHYKSAAIVPQKEIITVHANTPKTEQRSLYNTEGQIYQGEVNVLSILETTKGITCCKYTEDLRNLAVGFNDGSIRLFDCFSGKCTYILEDDECRSLPGPVTALKNRPVSTGHPTTNTLISSNVNGLIKGWKYKYEQCLYTIREKRQTLGLCYHPRLSKFVTYGDDATLNMYDEEVRIQERSFTASQTMNWTRMDGHRTRIYACSFHPKCNHEFVSGGWDDTVYCWDDRQPFATGYFCGVHMCGEGLSFNKRGTELFTCAWQENDYIQIWDYGSRKLINTIKPDEEPSKLYCGKVIAQTDFLICGGSDSNILRLVDIKLKSTKCCVLNNPEPIIAFDFGRVRSNKKRRNATESIMKIQKIPMVAYVTGNMIHTVDFG